MTTAEKKHGRFRLLIHKKKDAKPIYKVVNRYVAFATNISTRKGILACNQLPEDYRKSWGIETEFRVQENVQDKTTSKNFTVRVLHIIFSTILYNTWVYANVRLARKLHLKLQKPKIKLTRLAHYFSTQIKQTNKPP
jgi:IS4 transposase